MLVGYWKKKKKKKRLETRKRKNFAVCDVIIKVYTQDEGVDQHP